MIVDIGKEEWRVFYPLENPISSLDKVNSRLKAFKQPTLTEIINDQDLILQQNIDYDTMEFI